MAITEHKLFKPAAGAALAALCGLVLWGTRLGEGWVNASYDNLFRFYQSKTAVTNVVLIQMDNTAYDQLLQNRGTNGWDRALHAELLNRLTAGGSQLVVFDIFFSAARNPDTDDALAEAMRRNGRVVLAADISGSKQSEAEIAKVEPPAPLFAQSATNWGIGRTDAEYLQTARRHWPFPAPDQTYTSLPWKAAELAGASLPKKPQKQWLRYYGPNGGWERVSYSLALSNDPACFRDKIVFIGNEPASSKPREWEEDKFCTPYRLTGADPVGGVEILATEFLNLMNRDWLRRPARWLEALALAATGILLGGGLCWKRSPLLAASVAIGAGLVALVATVYLSYYTNYWFPWLVITGGQVPCALAWALAAPRILPARTPGTDTAPLPPRTRRALLALRWLVGADSDRLPPRTRPAGTPPPPVLVEDTQLEPAPETADYQLFHPPFGHGAYGKVWVVRNAIDQWQALKAVYIAKFKGETAPYEREFNGIRRYKPVSDKHPGLLRIDFISAPRPEGYFYYVMELGDSLEPGWEGDPRTYEAGDLDKVRKKAPGERLPPRECARIGLALTEALEFLHAHDLTHRDIKPGNIIFVRGQPKLADVGLVAEIRRPGRDVSLVGTPDYMPPQPEPVGTPQADIFGLGMVLYVILTGRKPKSFPEITETLIEKANPQDFRSLNAVIVKACQTDITQRYGTAAEMHAALLEAQGAMDQKIA